MSSCYPLTFAPFHFFIHPSIMPHHHGHIIDIAGFRADGKPVGYLTIGYDICCGLFSHKCLFFHKIDLLFFVPFYCSQSPCIVI